MMSLRVSFELDDDDLKHFRLIMREARNSATHLAPEDILVAAESLLRTIRDSDLPGFVQERLAKLRSMIDMLTDTDWRLPHHEAKRVMNALTYFAEPEDLIPDHIPGLGFLDDAIMIELVLRELRHEIEAYADFCAYRDRRCKERGSRSSQVRDRKLESRREELHARMRRRRKVSEQKRSGSSVNLFRS